MQWPANSAEQARFPAAHRVLQDAICDRAFPCAAYGVHLRGESFVNAVGRFTYDLGSRAVQPTTIFDLASVSKVMATTAMAMLLWQRGQLDLDCPVGEMLPQFVRKEGAASLKRCVTTRMLLAHSSGLPAYERLYERCPTQQALMDACLHMPLESAPDTVAVYSDIAFIVLGHLLETLAEDSLDSYCRREIFMPLGMASTLFRPPPEMRPAIPPTALDNAFRHRRLQGEVHDDNCYVLGGISGHAGIFSNVVDMLLFARCLLQGGAPVFTRDAIVRFTQRQPIPSGTPRALGWDTPSAPSSSGDFLSARSVGHLGYTGTSLWIDMERELAVVLLTNRTFPGSGIEGISQKIQQVRPIFHNALLRDLKDSK
ncbi:MAG: serine hydrolase domain-containing protein [Acidobacteriaceae bacterium]